MNLRAGLSVVALGLLAVALLACMGLTLATGYSLTWDSDGLRASNPEREAQATRMALLAQDESAQRALERRRLEAEVEAAEAAKAALTVRDTLIALGVGVGVLVVCISAGFAVGAWLTKRATTIYPNQAGQYPVIVSRGWGWVTYHDPSRGLSAGALYRTPTVMDAAAAAAARLLGRGRADDRPQLTAEYPPTGSEAVMAQAAMQANAVSLTAAANRQPHPQSLPRGGRGGDATFEVLPMARRMPTLVKIDDLDQLASVRQTLVEMDGSE